MSRRLGVLAVSHDLWIAKFGGIFSSYEMTLVAAFLKLPDNCKVLAISHHHFFDRDCAALKLECPDFAGVPEGGIIPEVYAEYNAEGFVRWLHDPLTGSCPQYIPFASNPTGGVLTNFSARLLNLSSQLRKKTLMRSIPSMFRPLYDKGWDVEHLCDHRGHHLTARKRDQMTPVVVVADDDLVNAIKRLEEMCSECDSGTGSRITMFGVPDAHDPKCEVTITYPYGTDAEMVSAEGCFRTAAKVEVADDAGPLMCKAEVMGKTVFAVFPYVRITLSNNTSGTVYWKSNGAFEMHEDEKEAVARYTTVGLARPFKITLITVNELREFRGREPLPDGEKPVGQAMLEDSGCGNLVVPACTCSMDTIIARGCQCGGK